MNLWLLRGQSSKGGRLRAPPAFQPLPSCRDLGCPVLWGSPVSCCRWGGPPACSHPVPCPPWPPCQGVQPSSGRVSVTPWGDVAGLAGQMWVLPAGPHPALTGLGDVTGSVVSGDRSHILIYRGSRADVRMLLPENAPFAPSPGPPMSHTGVDSAWHLGCWAWATSLKDGSTLSGRVAVETGLPGPVSSPVKQLS